MAIHSHSVRHLRRPERHIREAVNSPISVPSNYHINLTQRPEQQTRSRHRCHLESHSKCHYHLTFSITWRLSCAPPSSDFRSSLRGQWALYTKALSASPSAVKVNIVNTASNFIITALLGAVVFGEKLPLLWWFGAGLLVAGSVIIGKREEGGEENEGRKKRE
jgi:ABC-type bacteriocin/lantibiotic exporter with double-glycine peptidase domain